jgi:hypothetical protein
VIAFAAAFRLNAAMTEPTKEPSPRRSRWVGRAVILAFGALLLVYFVPLAISLLTPH